MLASAREFGRGLGEIHSSNQRSSLIPFRHPPAIPDQNDLGLCRTRQFDSLPLHTSRALQATDCCLVTCLTNAALKMAKSTVSHIPTTLNWILSPLPFLDLDCAPPRVPIASLFSSPLRTQGKYKRHLFSSQHSLCRVEEFLLINRHLPRDSPDFDPKCPHSRPSARDQNERDNL